MITYESKRLFKKGDLLSKYSESSYINKTGHIIRPNELTYLASGENSSIWKYENEAFKIFFSDCLRFALDNETYKIMKDLPLKRTIKAKDSYSEYTEKPNYESFAAYIMDFQEEKEISLFDMPTATFLENIRLIEEDGILLAKNGIEMHDLKVENSIINQTNELYLLDTDMYKLCYFQSKEYTANKNKIEINWLIKSAINSLLEQESSRNINLAALKKIQTIFSNRLDDLDSSRELEKLFNNYENPKEYFLSLKK